MQASTPTQVEAKTFYSRSAGMMISIDPSPAVYDLQGRKVSDGPGRVVSFTAAGKNHGVLTTKDPGAIEYIERQMAEGNPDFLTPEEFVKENTPPETRVAAAEDKLAAAQRQIQEQNKLIESLRAQGRLPK